ncbi:MAG: LCP family protein, partial [Oscillospiraceae bacterium]|nr:LCP family protein [Oscillospiraceae bacterium]
MEQLVASLLSLLFLTTAAVATVKYLVRAPEPDQAPPAVEDAAAQQAPEQDDQAVPTTNGRARKQYCYTILLSGLDNDNGGSDTNILMRFDAVHKSINLVSLPRDTLLNHTWRSNKLNFAYASGGTELLRKEISNLLGIPVDFHVTVDLKGFIS